MSELTNYQSVTDVNTAIHSMFQHNYDLRSIHMTGEISNFRKRPRHQYFTLKDDKSHISAVMWASQFRKVKFDLKNGMKVNVVGTVQTYVRNGVYQICIWHIEPNGVGQLYIQLKQVQKKLADEGLFNPAHKKPIPSFPKRIAVITSQSGAVIRDIIKNVRVRYPIAQVVLYPANVQGRQAVPSLVRRLNQVSRNHDCDDVIIGRGGGSLEDLWCFESAEVAHAIYNCTVPVVSSVGHGTDRTTADLVADKSVAVPADAAVACTTPTLPDTLQAITNYQNRLVSSYRAIINNDQKQLNSIMQSAVFQNPKKIYQSYDQKLQTTYLQLINSMKDVLTSADKNVTDLSYSLKANSPQHEIEDYQQKTKFYQNNLVQDIKDIIDNKQSQFHNLVGQLNQLSPLQRMAQGYSIVSSHHKIVHDANKLHVGDDINIRFRNGSKNARIEPKAGDKHDEERKVGY